LELPRVSFFGFLPQEGRNFTKYGYFRSSSIL
jgi:hypothetical protein